MVSVQRCAMVDDINKESPTIIHMQSTRVVFGVSASPFCSMLLYATTLRSIVMNNQI